MKQISILLITLFASAMLEAQKNPSSIICGNQLFSQMVREKHPDLHRAFEQTFEAARLKKPVADRSPLDIKVVVHVVWKENTENLADSVIENQIRILNEDFNRLNSDTANLRTFFQPVAGSAAINFQLAEVIRVNTNTLFEIDIFGGTLLPELKKTSLGGSDAWNTEQYLNIWICNVQPTTIFGIPVGQILGFAFPPNDLNNWPTGSSAPSPSEDGVVIDFRVFGSNNPNVIESPGGGGTLTIKGRTPTHEVGHYLGLRHIWGDGGLLGPNDCAQSDGVDDTPFANAQSNFDCDKTKNTCEQVEAYYNDDIPDLVENFMDYSREDCMNMFTKGQVTLMRNVLLGPRNGLVASSGLSQTNATDLNWSILPNPSDGRLSIKVQQAENQAINIQVLNMEGKNMWQNTPTAVGGSVSNTVDGSAWPNGIYFVALQTVVGRSVKKWVKY